MGEADEATVSTPVAEKSEKKEKEEKKKALVEAIAVRVETPDLPKNPDEEKAALLYVKLQESFIKAKDEPNDNLLGLDNTVGSYRAASKAMERMDEDPAEVNKAISALREFHRQVGETDYRVEIDLTREELNQREAELRAELGQPGKHGWISDEQEREKRIDADVDRIMLEEHREAIKQRVREDVARMPQMDAHHRMQSTYEMIATKMDLEDQVASSLPLTESAPTDEDSSTRLYKDGLSLVDLPARGVTRFAAFEIQKAQNRIDYTEENLVDLMGDEELAKEMIRIREQRGTEGEDEFIPWGERSGEERETQVTQRYDTLRVQILSAMGQKGLDAFDNLPGEKRRPLVQSLVQSEVEAEHSFLRIEDSLAAGDASVISERLTEAKQARLIVKDNLAQLQVALAAQRSENSIQSLVKAAQDFARGRTKTLGGLHDAGRIAVEALVDKTGALVEPMKQGVIKAVDQTSSMAEGAADKFVEEVTKVSEAVHTSVIKEGDLVLQDLIRTGEDLKSKAISVKPGLERRRLDSRSWFWDKVGKVATEADRSVRNLGLAFNLSKHRTSLDVREGFANLVESATGKKVLEEEDRKVFAEKRERLEKLRVKAVDRIKQTVKEKHEKSPGYEYFWNEAEKHVKKNFPPGEEEEEEVIEVTPDVEPSTPEPEESEKVETTTPEPEESEDKTDKTKAPAKKKEKDKTKWKPEDEGDQKLWEGIDEQEQQAIEAGSDLYQYRELADSLYKANGFLNYRFDASTLQGDPVYDDYQRLSKELSQLYEETRTIPKSKDTPENIRYREQQERDNIRRYKEILEEKWKVYEQLKKKKPKK